MTENRYRLDDRDGAAEAIRRMGEDDLRFLNRLICERLKLIAQARSTVMLAHFSVGDRVAFRTSAGQNKIGVVLRLNKKTASIRTDDGQRWNVHPGFLSPLAGRRGIPAPDAPGM
jgi:hypothetical protein